MSVPPAPLRFLGLRLKREVGIVAFLAFVMSSGSLGIQLVQYLQGPQVRMTAGERVNLIRGEHPAAEGRPYLKINARLNYLNTGALGRDAIIARERLHVYFGRPGAALPNEYRWLHHELFIADAAGLAAPIDIEGAHSFVAPGAGTASHQTTFVAFPDSPTRSYPADGATPDPGWIKWDQFGRHVTADQPRMLLRFIATDAAGHDLPAFDCAVRITASVIADLRATGWATALCLPPD